MITALKSRLLDIIELDPDQKVSCGQLLQNFLSSIQATLNAKSADLYGFRPLEETCFLEATLTASKENEDYFVSGLSTELLYCAEKEKKAFLKTVTFPEHKKYDFVLFLRNGGENLGAVAIQLCTSIEVIQYSDAFLEELAEVCSKFISRMRNLYRVITEEQRYRQLFRVTEKFHSSMNVEDVLEEIIDTLKEVYPTFEYYLLLSQDRNENCSLPIKDLDYDSDNTAAVKAYASGSLQFEDFDETNSILYAPLKGKQGIYGVLQVIAPDRLPFPEYETEFIMLLASTGGSALENASLYQQARRLNADLKLINETSHRLNSNLRLNEAMSYMCEQVITSLRAEEVGFVVPGENNRFIVLEGSPFFLTPEADQYIQLFGSQIQSAKEPLFMSDFSLKPDFPGVYRSAMGVPMIQNDSLSAFALVLHKNPYHFTFETFKLMQSLIHHYTLAFTNSMLREELEQMVITDHLTKLCSRNYLDEKMSLSMIEDQFGSFILIDIDNFKAVNDTYGHQVGDEVLVQVANLIKNNIRGSDIGSRWGGEEMAIYLPGAPLDTGMKIANRLAERVERWTKPSVTISCGVSWWHKEDTDNLLSLFRRADQALYLAKESGKNKVIIQSGEHKGFFSTQ